jgi:hypothetical protein
MSIQIDENQIEHKCPAGKLNGDPLVYVKTVGGLHALFLKKGKEVTTLAAAPHVAIMKWIANKKEKDIEWDKDFNQDPLQKSVDQFNSLRRLFFRPLAESPINHNDDSVLLYNGKDQFQIVSKSEITQDFTGWWMRELHMADYPKTINKDDYPKGTDEK